MKVIYGRTRQASVVGSCGDIVPCRVILFCGTMCEKAVSEFSLLSVKFFSIVFFFFFHINFFSGNTVGQHFSTYTLSNKT